MKRLFLVLACVAVLGGCTSKRADREIVHVPPPVPANVMLDADGAPIERVPFRPGVSSVTVENMAKQIGCRGGVGAGLMSAPGPVETYRMICDNGTMFSARCELRQCRSLGSQPIRTGPLAAPAADTPHLASVEGVAPQAAQLPAGPLAPMGARQVPRLDVKWDCVCTHNNKVPEVLAQAYANAAAEQGYTVSQTEVASVTITDFRQRPPAVRVMFGIFAGKDRLRTRTSFRNKQFETSDYSVNAWVGMNGVSSTVAKQMFAGLRQD